MLLKTMTVGPVETNCYLVGDEQAGACALVDPGDSAQALLSMVEESGLRLEAIFLTHGHYDHRDAVADILEKYPELPVYIHEKEKLRTGLPERYFYGGPCKTYAEGDTVQVGSIPFRVLETPGHTAGSVTLVTSGVMLSGDTLFAGTCGRCDLPGGSIADMLASLRRLGELEGDYQVLPGHGPASTLEQERRRNPYVRQAMRR